MNKKITSKSKKTSDLGYCLYGAKKIFKLIKVLSAEIDGVRLAKNIEHIHRMRVTTRRIRAALPVFTCCFKAKVGKKWRQEIRSITRGLGAARDLDVKADFLNSFITGIPPEDMPPEYLTVAIGLKESLDQPELTTAGKNKSYIRPGLEYLLMRIQQQRILVQPIIITALDRLVASEVVEDINEWCLQAIKAGGSLDNDQYSPYAYAQGHVHIVDCLEELYAFQPFVAIPEKKEEHHDMRIAAKRVRYTMELFSGFYQKEFTALIQVIKGLQELLGDLHDCDVWIDYLAQFIAAEKKRSQDFFGNDHFFGLIEPGITYLRTAKKQRRQEIYELFVAFWQTHLEDGVFQNKLETIIRETGSG